MLTLFLLPGGTEEERVRAVQSLSSVRKKVVELREDIFDIHYLNVLDTPWYMFLYGYEYLDPKLNSVIPKLLATQGIHFFVIMKKELQNGLPKISQAPRLMRKVVRMQPDSLLPESNLFVHERVLDGFIRQ